MFTTVLSLGLLGFAVAAPSTPLSARQAPVYPPTSQSYGFRLVANVTDPCKDFTPSINGFVFEGIHVGAALNDAVLYPPTSTATGNIFYLNGTAEQVHFGQTHVLNDEGTPLYPYGISVQNQTQFDYEHANEHDVALNVGPGTEGVTLTSFPDPIPQLATPGSGTFVACNNTVPYYQRNFITLQYAYATYTGPNGSYDYQQNIPAGCASIALLPQCAQLEDLPAGSASSHQYAAKVQCYEDVASIDWTKYSAF